MTRSRRRLTVLLLGRFDAAVVLVSLGMISTSTGNGVVKQLRILRVFRIIRVFGRIGQLREIVNAISSAIIPAAQALVLLGSYAIFSTCLMLLAMCSLLGSSLWPSIPLLACSSLLMRIHRGSATSFTPSTLCSGLWRTVSRRVLPPLTTTAT